MTLSTKGRAKAFHVFGEEQGDYVCTTTTNIDGLTTLKCKQCGHSISGLSTELQHDTTCEFCEKVRNFSKQISAPKGVMPPRLGKLHPFPILQPNPIEIVTQSEPFSFPKYIDDHANDKKPDTTEITILKEMIEQANKDYDNLATSTNAGQALAMHMISRTVIGLKNVLQILVNKNV